MNQHKTARQKGSNIVVIGGGMAGSAAAHTLKNAGFSVTILEKEDRLGGRMRSEVVDGVSLEMGSGFISRIYTNVLDFLHTNKLDDKLFQQSGRSGMMRHGSIHMIGPKELAGTKVLSWRAKWPLITLLAETLRRRPRLDLHRLWLADIYDQLPVASKYTTPGRKEFMEYVLQPVLNAYLYWTPEHTSEAMMSILINAALQKGGTLKYRGGLARIPEFAAKDCTVHLGCEVKSVTRQKNGQFEIAALQDKRQTTFTADGVVCATIAPVVPKIIPHLSKQQKEFFAAIDYSATVVMAQSYKTQDTLEAKAVAFPRLEDNDLAAITLSPEQDIDSEDFKVSGLKMYASGAIGKQLAKKSDEQIILFFEQKLAPVRDQFLRNGAAPLSTRIQRWPEVIPHFDVGHIERLRAFHDGAIENDAVPLVFAGDYIGAPYIEGAFTSGVAAASRLADRLTAIKHQTKE